MNEKKASRQQAQSLHLKEFPTFQVEEAIVAQPRLHRYDTASTTSKFLTAHNLLVVNVKVCFP